MLAYILLNQKAKPSTNNYGLRNIRAFRKQSNIAINSTEKLMWIVAIGYWSLVFFLTTNSDIIFIDWHVDLDCKPRRK